MNFRIVRQLEIKAAIFTFFGPPFLRRADAKVTLARRRRRQWRKLPSVGVQNGHFPYIFEGLTADSKNQKDAHLKMRSIGTE